MKVIQRITGGVALFLMFAHFWNGWIDVWNEFLLWGVGIGQMSEGYLIPQVIWFALLGALIFSAVVFTSYEILCYLFD